MDYGKAFKNVRESAGYSRAEIAEQLGITPNALWKIENKRTTPKQNTIVKFCRFMGVPLAFLFISALETQDYKL